MVSNVRLGNPIKKKVSSIKKQKKKTKSVKSVNTTVNTVKPDVEIGTPNDKKVILKKIENKDSISIEELSVQYPFLKDKELVTKFLNVPLNNNQKGRIRQVLKDQLKGTSETILPDVIYSKILGIIKGSESLTGPELRKLRILYNMLKNAVQTDKPDDKKKKKKKNKNKKKEKANVENEATKDTPQNTEIGVKSVEKKPDKENADKEVDNDKKQKVKGSKRYVVFVGNLPPEIDKEKIMMHFNEMAQHIVSVRIPKLEKGKKSSIAYVELNDERSYELALSKHHSMMGTKRINVLYTTQKNSKISTTEAKSKSAKLIALQKSGKLAGSVPLNRKRSHRRAKAKRAQKLLSTK